MTTINWYDVLLVQPDCTTTDIKTSYRDLVQIYHPDKKGGNAEMFDLITHAYNILVNPKTRESYDKLYTVSKQSESDWKNLKDRSKDYNTSLDNTKKTKESAEIDFDTIFAEMDIKYGLKRDAKKKIIDAPVTAGEIKKKVEDLETIRDHDDIENVPDRIFDKDEDFEIDKFNEAFDNIHQKHTDLIPHQGNPLAYNTINEFGSFSSVENYDALFVEDNDLGNNMFSSVKMNEVNTPKKMNKKDLDKLHGADYVKTHNHRDANYAKTLEEKMVLME